MYSWVRAISASCHPLFLDFRLAAAGAAGVAVGVARLAVSMSPLRPATSASVGHLVAVRVPAHAALRVGSRGTGWSSAASGAARWRRRRSGTGSASGARAGCPNAWTRGAGGAASRRRRPRRARASAPAAAAPGRLRPRRRLRLPRRYGAERTAALTFVRIFALRPRPAKVA